MWLSCLTVHIFRLQKKELRPWNDVRKVARVVLMLMSLCFPIKLKPFTWKTFNFCFHNVIKNIHIMENYWLWTRDDACICFLDTSIRLNTNKNKAQTWRTSDILNENNRQIGYFIVFLWQRFLKIFIQEFESL